MVNTDRLLKTMRQKGVAIKDIANNLGLNQSTVYRRFNRSGEKFTVDEVEKIAELLDLNSVELESIFFNRKLA